MSNPRSGKLGRLNKNNDDTNVEISAESGLAHFPFFLSIFVICPLISDAWFFTVVVHTFQFLVISVINDHCGRINPGFWETTHTPLPNKLLTYPSPSITLNLTLGRGGWVAYQKQGLFPMDPVLLCLPLLLCPATSCILMAEIQHDAPSTWPNHRSCAQQMTVSRLLVIFISHIFTWNSIHRNSSRCPVTT